MRDTRGAPKACCDPMESDNLQKFRSNFRSLTELRVAWGEIDAFQHVNNAMYFRYFESARIEHLSALHAYDDPETRTTGTVVASTQCRFRIPLTYPDLILVGSRAADLSADRFTMEYAIYSHRHGRVAAEGSAVVVSVTLRDGRKTLLPEIMRAAIEQELAGAR